MGEKTQENMYKDIEESKDLQLKELDREKLTSMQTLFNKQKRANDQQMQQKYEPKSLDQVNEPKMSVEQSRTPVQEPNLNSIEVLPPSEMREQKKNSSISMDSNQVE